MTLDSCHQPHTWLFDVGKVVVAVGCEIVCLYIERIMMFSPLNLQIECTIGAITLVFFRLGIVELPFTIFEGEVPLCREFADNTVIERGDKFVAEEGHA